MIFCVLVRKFPEAPSLRLQEPERDSAAMAVTPSSRFGIPSSSPRHLKTPTFFLSVTLTSFML